jgi:perosamine synthetase
MIPVNRPLLDGNEKKYLVECIDTQWISSEGPFIKEFEDKFSKSVNRRFGVAVSSGTAALDIALAALELASGDEVIMPTFTIISCITSILNAKAVPVLVDCNDRNFNMDISLIEQKISKRTKAILVVHIYGLPIDMDPVLELANKYKLKIIEDAAEMHGQQYKGRPCGSFGDISIFSFYPNKLITTGEGGMVVTDDPHLAERANSLRNLCFNPQQRFVHEELGWNYRMTNMQAAIGVAQLERLSEFVEIKKNLGQLYNKLLSGIDEIFLPIPGESYAENIYWVYPIVLKPIAKMNAKDLARKLSDLGVQTRPFFWPMHKQPIFEKLNLFLNESYPNSEYIAEFGLYLPSGVGTTELEISDVSKVLRQIFND